MHLIALPLSSALRGQRRPDARRNTRTTTDRRMRIGRGRFSCPHKSMNVTILFACATICCHVEFLDAAEVPPKRSQQTWR